MKPLEREVLAAIGRGWLLTMASGKRCFRTNWTTEPPIPVEQLTARARCGGNIAVRTGAASRVVVLDVDAGSEFFVDCETPTVVTPGGGRHYYFEHPAFPVANSVGLIAPRVDMKGDNGAALLVGSMHPVTRGCYQWAVGLSPEDVEIAPLPAAILQAIMPKPRAVPTAPLPKTLTREYIEAALRKEFERVSAAPRGTRNHRLYLASYRIARFVHAGYLQAGPVEKLLLEAANNCGLDAHEALDAIRSGLRRRGAA